jgi:glycine betaine catabolism B
MKVTVKGPIRDLLMFFRLTGIRKKRFRAAAADFPVRGAMNDLAEKLHPPRLDLLIKKVLEETQDTRTFRLVREAAGPLPFFRAGQYISVKITIGGNEITRPYSISSLPHEALDPGFYDITIRRKDRGFFTSHVWDNWNTGTPVTTSGPLGQFCFERLRDKRKLVFIAGGSGITPFKPLITDLIIAHPRVEMILFYGVADIENIIFQKYLDAIAEEYPERLKVVYVNSGAEGDMWEGESGLIDRRLIRRHAEEPENYSHFVCGPPEMYSYIDRELSSFHLRPGRIRKEAPGDSFSAAGIPDFPENKMGKQFKLSIHSDGKTCETTATPKESILSAIERAGISAPSECRSGECGFCRSKLISGEFYVINEHDGRRQADRKFGYFHPCSSYPLSDLEITVPNNPAHRRP